MARTVDVEKRKEITLQAFEVIRERGVHQVTMSAIAEALGMKRPTLYWYFRDLGQLFEAVLGVVLDRQRETLAERIRAVAHPVDALAAYVEALHAFFEDDEDFVIVLIQLWAAGQSDRPQRVLEITRAHFEPIRAATVAALEAGVAAGTVAPVPDAGAVVDLVASLADGALLHHLSRGMPMAPVRELLWTAVLDPLRRDPGGPT